MLNSVIIVPSVFVNEDIICSVPSRLYNHNNYSEWYMCMS